MKVKIEWSKEDLEKLQVGVIVEQWKHLDTGRYRRAFNAEFPKLSERIMIRKKLYPLFHNWVLVKGLPETNSTLTHKNYELAKRLANFFATI
jgi:hypothetical protein